MSIVIFTPTYNRAHLLARCYDSLLSQTDKDFVWLIVDDGSNDGTRIAVEKWIADGKIGIRYIYQPNGGKHKAHNTAVGDCNEDYMLIYDSDDILAPSCVATLKKYILDLDNNPNVCGLIANKYKISDGSVIGENLPIDMRYVSARDLYQKYGFKGDTLRLYKVNILKQFPFPVVNGEKFIYENVVFDQIDVNYEMKVIYEKLYFCDYLPDGYTANAAKIKLHNPIGYSLSLNSAVTYSGSILKSINWTLLYIIWCKRMDISDGFSHFNKKALYCLLYLPACVLNLLKQPKFFFRIINQRGRI